MGEGDRRQREGVAGCVRLSQARRKRDWAEIGKAVDGDALIGGTSFRTSQISKSGQEWDVRKHVAPKKESQLCGDAALLFDERGSRTAAWRSSAISFRLERLVPVQAFLEHLDQIDNVRDADRGLRLLRDLLVLRF